MLTRLFVVCWLQVSGKKKENSIFDNNYKIMLKKACQRHLPACEYITTRGESTRRNRVEFCSYKMNESCLSASAERAIHTNNDQFLSQIERLFFVREYSFSIWEASKIKVKFTGKYLRAAETEPMGSAMCTHCGPICHMIFASRHCTDT